MGHSTRFPSARPLDVLLVEDSDTDAIWIEHLFSRARDGAYKRTRVGALKEAAELADARAFDVALLDLNLPDSHGVETLTRLRARAPSLPIVVLTGIDDDHLVANTLELGAEDYLTKGHVNAEILERAIRYAIHRMRAEELLRQREKRSPHRRRQRPGPDCALRPRFAPYLRQSACGRLHGPEGRRIPASHQRRAGLPL
ncbi:MAG: response regulator [Planctomycetota bacterium]|nr:response regulator [Planctomycetota bacterium]